MTQTVDAVFEHGQFRPVTTAPLGLFEGQHVRIVLESVTPEEILRVASQVYEGLTDAEIDEVEKIAFDRSNFFGDRSL